MPKVKRKAKSRSGKKVKQAKKLLLISLVSVAVLAALLIYFGGSGFRWFGKKGEHLGAVVRENSDRMGSKADDVREGMKDAAKDVKRDLVDKVKGKD